MPENGRDLPFNFITPKYIKFVGNAASVDCKNKPIVNGLIVKKDFQYQLMNEELG